MPIGPYQNFGDCVAAQRRKGHGGESSRKICGQIEQNTLQALRRRAETSTVKYEDNGHLFIRAFLLDAAVNINAWGISPESLHKNINSFIGKPLVLTDTYKHPLPPELNRVGGEEQYDDDDNPYNVVNVDDIVDHWLEYQEAYRIGSIIDVVEKKGTYYAIIEVTSPAARDAFKNNDVPLFVSPAIAQLDPYEDATRISNWTGIHLAIVSDPAYTIKKALVTGQCHDEKEKCLLQLRQAAIERKDFPKTGCGFCRTKALRRYANYMYQYLGQSEYNHIEMPLIRWASSEQDFLESSSLEFSGVKLKTSELTDVNTNNANTDNNNNNANNNVEENKTQQQETVTTTTSSKTVKPAAEEIAKAAEEFAVKIAGMEECVQIFTQNGVAPDQSMQICKLAAKALMENQQNQQQQPGGGNRNTSNGPGISGQFGSISDYEKEIAKQEVKIGQLTEELKNYKKGDKTDAQRIAELEEQLGTVKTALKEKELEAYLVTKIGDEDARQKKIKRFAELNMTLEDLKDIYETSTDPKIASPKAKTAAVIQSTPIEQQQQQQQQSPLSRVKLQVASTNEPKEDTKQVNEIRDRNNRIVSSLLSKKEFM